MIFALPAGLTVPISFLGTSQFGKALSPWGHVESSSFHFFLQKSNDRVATRFWYFYSTSTVSTNVQK